jgi:lipopolysaccharide/colanic/teichoic acid biosynthesis glycosyltransferase
LSLAAGAAALGLALPLMAVIAVLIKITSRGPVIFKQTRVGIDRRRSDLRNGNRRRQVDHGGRPFTILKFRTMRHTNGDRDVEVWASPDDPRVTWIGRILRKYRLDELPQLFNVLLGDMNLVGPRPEQPTIFRQLRNRIDDYSLRQQVLPGITGWAQVRHHYDQSIDDVGRKLAFDLEYLRQRSAVQDLRIMLLTVPVVMFRRGAW